MARIEPADGNRDAQRQITGLSSSAYPGSRFVAVAMDRVEFHRSVKDGSILRFDLSPKTRRGAAASHFMPRTSQRS